jgi:short-subunit dehydrogenase
MAKPTALITGASSGIGGAYARRLARDGHDLVLVARRRERLDALAWELGQAHGTAVEVLTADLGDTADLRRVEARVAQGGPVDMLVNNAGFGVFQTLAELDPEVMDEMVRVNVMAPLRLSRAAVPPMLARGGGAIINVCSGSVFFPMPDSSIYAASKSLLSTFTRSLHADVGGRGIAVQALVPGLVATEFFDRATTDGDAFLTGREGMVMEPDELVEASLIGLARGEVVCIPSLPDYAAFERYQAAEMEILSGVSKERYADRYR